MQALSASDARFLWRGAACQWLAYLLTSGAPFDIDYFHARVLAEIERWPADVWADYAHFLKLLTEHGPSSRLPHLRAFGDELFELRPRGRCGIGRAFYCFLVGRRVDILHAFIKKTQPTPDKELKLNYRDAHRRSFRAGWRGR